ncbi:MAG: hypothetical protein WCE75_13130 [Terracidiphilus sp.]
MMRWVRRAVLAAGIAFVALYGGDWAIYKLRGSPRSTVNVNRFLTIPLKGGKQEIDYLGTSPLSCSLSLFPQGGQSACWQLRRNTNQNTNL